ncbi:MAG: hypothetical protein ACRC33_12700 [Gemmataceae bacterium]
MLYHVNLVDPPTLIEGLLEASLRLFHNRSAVIQRVFHEHCMEVLGRAVGEEQIERPDDRPAAVEARARGSLRECRRVMGQRQREMIRDEHERRAARDAAIRAYVAGRQTRAAA